MTSLEPIEVARTINDAFSATPFDVVRETTSTTSGRFER